MLPRSYRSPRSPLLEKRRHLLRQVARESLMMVDALRHDRMFSLQMNMKPNELGAGAIAQWAEDELEKALGESKARVAKRKAHRRDTVKSRLEAAMEKAVEAIGDASSPGDVEAVERALREHLGPDADIAVQKIVFKPPATEKESRARDFFGGSGPVGEA